MRRSAALLLSLFISIAGLMAQSSIRDALQRSRTSLVYRISADTAESYIQKGIHSPDAYLGNIPFTTWQTDSSRYQDLPVGNYFILAVNGNKITTEYYCQSNLRVFPVNDQYRVQFEVRDSMGNTVPNARLWMDGKEIPFNISTASFQARQRKPDDAVIRVAVPGDTLFLEIGSTDEIESGWSQWWTNFRYTRAGNIIAWPVVKTRFLLNDHRNRYYYGRRARKRQNALRNG
ncbi:MAG TPA: hypothetical protein VK644_03995, partial [Chitinophagaceae bacterium]|nr:hypothetical protein [Chitinophagaceae bacterium]